MNKKIVVIIAAIGVILVAGLTGWFLGNMTKPEKEIAVPEPVVVETSPAAETIPETIPFDEPETIPGNVVKVPPTKEAVAETVPGIVNKYGRDVIDRMYRNTITVPITKAFGDYLEPLQDITDYLLTAGYEYPIGYDSDELYTVVGDNSIEFILYLPGDRILVNIDKVDGKYVTVKSAIALGDKPLPRDVADDEGYIKEEPTTVVDSEILYGLDGAPYTAGE